jgi:predicted nucleotidyltransferase
MYTFGKPNNELIKLFKQNEKFNKFVKPMSELDFIRDATFFIRHDGLMIFSEGYGHPKDKLIGNIIYKPDKKGKKSIFGVKYSSVIKNYLDNGEEEWIPYEEQLKSYYELDPSLNSARPCWANFKLQFDITEFIGFVPSRHSMKIIREMSDDMNKYILNLAEIFSMDPYDIGCTGSMALGNFEDPHDLDLIFHGTPQKIKEIVYKIYEITQHPENQVWEFGVKWAVRFYDVYKNMICSFFSYTNIDDIPLKDFECKIIKNNITVKATISDDTHSGYMPTFLPLKDNDCKIDNLHLIIYNGGLRGEYKTNDRIKATGILVDFVRFDKNDTIKAILVTGLDQTEKIEDQE